MACSSGRMSTIFRTFPLTFTRMPRTSTGPAGLRWIAALLVGLLLGACTHRPRLEVQQDEAGRALRALQAGDFTTAGQEADLLLNQSPDNPHAQLVSAIVLYVETSRQLIRLFGPSEGSDGERRMRSLARRYPAVLQRVEQTLAVVDGRLARAAAEPGLTLELCPACWEVDWNMDGHLDERERSLLELEQDAAGQQLPAEDPRRRPTFRFDQGDLVWARAFLAFQRAAFDLGLAYDWSELFTRRFTLDLTLHVPLVAPERMVQLRQRLEQGLELSGQARRLILAETDDTREWLPSPRQKDHPLPLPVDSALFDTWELLLGDLQRLIRGEEGLRLNELAGLIGAQSRDASGELGLDVGQMLSHPKDLHVEGKRVALQFALKGIPGAAAELFGPAYVRPIRPSPLPGRLARMKQEIDAGVEPLERKLRYLLWVN